MRAFASLVLFMVGMTWLFGWAAIYQDKIGKPGLSWFLPMCKFFGLIAWAVVPAAVLVIVSYCIMKAPR